MSSYAFPVIVALAVGLAVVMEVMRRNRLAQTGRSQRMTVNEAALEHLVDGLLAVDADLIVQAVNPAFVRLLQTDASRLVGGRADQVLPPVLADSTDRAMKEGEVVRDEIDLPRGRVGDVVASPMGSDGAAGCVVVIRDVTREREADRMKTDFIATVSHEFRTPLTAIQGFTKINQKRLEARVFPHVPEDDERARKAVDTIRENVRITLLEAQRLGAMVNDVLDISKMEAGEMEWTMVPLAPAVIASRAIDSARGLFADEVELRVEIHEELPTVLGDVNRLLQVLINLLSNAAKFTKDGSVVLRVVQAPEGVEFSVTDTGSGIAPDEQRSVFERFKQVRNTLTDKPRGTGLGLPICRQIVVAHAGRIWLESEPGRGSRFAFWIPEFPPEKRPDGDEAGRSPA
jgi:signal transduction histidine kinase